MRFFSALFAVASIPAIAILGNRLAGRGPALAASRAGGCELGLPLPRGVRAHVQPLPVRLDACRSSPSSGRPSAAARGAWILWAVAMLLTIGSHQYGALVLGAQGLYVLVTRTPAAAGDPRVRRRVPAGDPALAEQPGAGEPARGRFGQRRRPAHAPAGVHVPLARRGRLVGRLRRRPGDRVPLRRARDRLAGADTPEVGGADRVRPDHARAVLPGRPVRRELRTPVTTSDLRAAVLRPRDRERDRRHLARRRAATGRCSPQRSC